MFKRCFFIYFLASFFCFPLFAQNGFGLKANKKRSRIPFELVNNLPVLKVNINGTDFSFILDTGVKSSLLFSSEAVEDFYIGKTVPVEIQGLGSDGPVKALKSQNNKVQVGNAIDPDHELYLIFDTDLNFSPRMGVPINGILGSDFFKNFVVEINYTSKAITIHDPSHYVLSKCRKCIDLPLNFVDGKPYINLMSSSKSITDELTVLIDSGSSDVLWLFDQKNYIQEMPKNYYEDFLGLGIGGNIYGKRSRIPQISVGDLHLKNVSASFPDEIAITIARTFEKRDGSVGGGFLKRFNIIFDYGNKTVRFKKNRRFAEPFNYNMSGLTIEHSGIGWLIDNFQFTLVPRYVVVDVREGSPAHLAGVKKEDEILSINGKASYRYKLYELIDLFSKEEGDKITLLINRGVVSKKIKFHLRKVF